MNNLQDKQFERLNNAVSLSDHSKNKMKRVIFNTPQNQKKYYFPKVLGLLLTIFVFGLSYAFIFDEAKDGNIKTSNVFQEEIIDDHTPEILPKVAVTESMFTIEWLSDSMDRGNHNLLTNIHGKLVISQDIHPVERGDILYYQMEQGEQIGRVIALPGETVEIRKGQVYIDNKKLNTFYGVATSLGLPKDEYYKKVNTENTNVEAMDQHFNTSLEQVLVTENTVFVLVDMWWRGNDSRVYGPIPFEQLQGKVLGYEE